MTAMSQPAVEEGRHDGGTAVHGKHVGVAQPPFGRHLAVSSPVLPAGQKE
jgi:hypothetical protein